MVELNRRMAVGGFTPVFLLRSVFAVLRGFSAEVYS